MTHVVTWIEIRTLLDFLAVYELDTATTATATTTTASSTLAASDHQTGFAG